MQKKYLSILTAFLVSFLVFPVFAMQPENLTVAKRKVIAYYESGEFQKDVDMIIRDSEKYLQKRVSEDDHSRKLAMVLDIDDTSLSNFPGNKKRDFAGLRNMIEDSFREADAPAIAPMLRLYNEAIRSGVSVFFITWRPDEFRSYTITNLQKSGYYGWSSLFMPTAMEHDKLSAQAYKTAVRKALTEQGYDIILNLGDQDSDLNGGYADHTDKIPNPLYSTAA